MGSAQLDPLAYEDGPALRAATGTEDAVGHEEPMNLKAQAAERIRAHRERRSKPRLADEPSGEQPSPSRSNPIAAAVAERYAQTPSYRAFLAEQAQRAVEQAARDAEQAAAEAEIAARNAQAVAQVQQQLMAELELWNAPQAFTPETAELVQPLGERGAAVAKKSEATSRPRTHAVAAAASPVAAPASVPVKQISTEGLTVRLYEDLGAKPRVAASVQAGAQAQQRAQRAEDMEESAALDEEILFRQAPVFEPFDVDPPTPLPANLLEFPRQLVAARKVRPRLAEGPLFEEQPRSPQLRIFEVEPEQVSIAPLPPSVQPEWANIHLDAQPAARPMTAERAAEQNAMVAHSATPLLASMLPPQTAPLELRLMATAVDLCLVGFAFTLFVGVTAHFAHKVPMGLEGAIAAAVTFAVLYPLYELLFFTFSDQTPGMRYARIGLCTLSDENPSRVAIRRRILAQLVAVCPFGLGILWALLDEDGLGWHDRISRMYQRAY